MTETSASATPDAFDLIVIGDVNPDLVLSSPDLKIEFDQRESLADSGVMTLGGSAAITACGASRLGLNTAFVGLVGDDMFGCWCREQLELCGVDTSMLVVDATVDTGVTVVLRREDDRAIITAPGSISVFGRSHIDLNRVSAAAHVHIGSYFLQTALQPDVAEIFDRARSAGATTSLDTNYDPADQWNLSSVLDVCDVLFPNEAEARRFGSSEDLELAVQFLVRRVGTVAVTLGSDGALVASGDQVDRATVMLEVDVVDAIGAGDTFDAGFIAGRIKGWDDSQALRLGIGAAALSVRGAGGTSMQGTLAEAMDAGGCSS